MRPHNTMSTRAVTAGLWGPQPLPRRRTLQLALRDEQELEEKAEAGRGGWDSGTGRDSFMEDEKQHLTRRTTNSSLLLDNKM